jgi:serine/threonine protein kinase/ABC-type branched-subunit amino acid transport system substrate-binding protein
MARGMAEGALGAELAGRYRFIGEIAHGGMADVYLTATKGGLGGFQKLVVIKLLRVDLAEEEEFRKMFLDEARLAARLNHPNVVQTHDVGEDNGRYYLAMEYVDGQSYDRIRRVRGAAERFHLGLQLQMLVQTLSGLHYAHELTDYDGQPLNVVHRDVTPSNILVGYDGQVKLLDFGVAKAIDSATETRAGVIKGKTGYMAPEAFTDSAHVDRRADIYSVGILFWEMLAGRRMWKALSASDRMQRAIAGDVQPLRELAPGVPAELERICKKALAPRPQDRYPTAAALQAELEAYLAANPPRATERDMGSAVSELFEEERQQVAAVIEHQLKGSGGLPRSLPDLAEFSPSASRVVTGFDSGLSRYSLAPSPVRAPPPAPPARRRLVVGGAIGAAVLVAGALLALGLSGREGPRPAATQAPLPDASAALARPSKVVRGVTDTEVLMGMSAAFSGPSRELGNRMKLGVETGFAVVNEAGGAGGRQLKLVALDDGYEGKRALENMAELLDQRKVFGVIGNVGTPTAVQTVPYALSRNTLFFGAFTGANVLRKDPPDRYVFNYRASYEEETAKMIHYLLDVKRLSPRSIVVFAQHDGYGDAGYDGAAKMLRKAGRAEGDLLRVGYERNTVDVDAAVRGVLDYNAATVTVHLPNGQDVTRVRHPVKAVILVATYKAAGRFIQRLKEAHLDATFLNVSFVGSNALAEELKELGPGFGEGVIVTQVVPHYDSGATGVIRYREALKKYHPDQEPDFISLEGYVVAHLLAEGLRRAGRDLDTERLVDALESIHDYDLGIGTIMSFGMSDHQSSHKVWGTVIGDKGRFSPLDME